MIISSDLKNEKVRPYCCTCGDLVLYSLPIARKKCRRKVKENGDVDELIVYEGGYVTLSSRPGVRLKIPEDVFAEVQDFLDS